jgi:hypothetical protein
VKRFLYGILANACVVTLGYLIMTLIPVGSWGPVGPLHEQIAASGLLGTVAAAAALLHVSLTSTTELGPVAAVVGACAVTTVCSTLLNLPALTHLADVLTSLTVVASAATGGLLGGSLGVLRRD